jgi:N-acetylneuraminate synthase/N,N'-diacetyllegionaminate synthase
MFLSTAFDLRSAEELVSLGVPALKVPSGELDNLPFIVELASFGLPLIISTGMGGLDEVERAYDAASGAPGVAFLHCVSAYPAPISESNLRAIATIRERLDAPVGWSDHTEGATTAIAATALGAVVFEKHLTVDQSLPGPDQAASEEPRGLARYVEAVRTAAIALGDGRKRPMPSEQHNRISVRRSLHAVRGLSAGHELSQEDVVALRPAHGLAPSTEVAGLRLARDLPAGCPVRAEDVW